MAVRKASPTAPKHLSPQQRVMHSMMLVHNDMKRVARECGKPDGVAPTEEEYHKRGRFTTTRVLKMCAGGEKSWVKAMNRLRLTPASENQIPEQDLVDDLRRVSQVVGTPGVMPTTPQYQEHGKFSSAGVHERLGDGRGWYGAAMRAGLKMDVNRAIRLLDKEALLAMYRRTALNMGKSVGGYGPSSREFERVTGIGLGSIQYRFGSWNAYVKEAGYKTRPSGGKQPI